MTSIEVKKANALVFAVLAAGLAGPAISQESANSYPSRPITLIFNTSGTTSADTELRLYQNPLRSVFNVPLVFDYKAGANGIIGAVYVARQRPDGYTYLASASTLVSLALLTADISYDLFKDFEPISMTSKKNFMVLVHPSGPYQTIRDYVAYARANPGKLNWSTSGDGSSTHLPGLLLHSATKTEVTFVPYKVSNDRLIDLIAGRVDVTVGTVLASMGFVKSGKMRAIAVTDSERSKLLPDLPTVAQSGIPELADYESTTWLGLFAPAKTPSGILNKFQGALRQVSKDPTIVKALDEADTVQVVSSPDQFKQFLVKEYSRLEKAIKASGIKPQ